MGSLVVDRAGNCSVDRRGLWRGKDHAAFIDKHTDLRNARYANLACSAVSMSRRSNRRSPIDPVLTLRRKEIDVDGILGADELVGGVRRNDENRSGCHHEFLSLRKDLAATLGNPRNLLVGVVVQRKHAALLHCPLH
jgi:hypothetical protein